MEGIRWGGLGAEPSAIVVNFCPSGPLAPQRQRTLDVPRERVMELLGSGASAPAWNRVIVNSLGPRLANRFRFQANGRPFLVKEN